MAQDGRDILEILKFELNFLLDGGYGRFPRSPWRAPNPPPPSASSMCSQTIGSRIRQNAGGLKPPAFWRMRLRRGSL